MRMCASMGPHTALTPRSSADVSGAAVRQARSMKRARDVRDQLVGLMERVEIDMVSHPEDHEAIKKVHPQGILRLVIGS